jgi:replicative DNA helicase
MTGGMRRGELLILGGRPSMGKTALGAVIAANVTQSGRGVVYFSLEMPVGLLVPRFLSARVWGPAGPAVAYQRILRGAVSADEARWLKSASEDFSAWPLVIDDDAGLGVGEIEARSRVIASRMQAKGQSLDLVVVDHLHRMRVPNATSRVNELSAISAGLAEAAKRLNCPVLALAQLNRGVETRDDKRPTLADLRESGSIEQDADLVAFAYRPGYYLERQRCSNPADEADRLADMEREGHKLELLIAKQRSGPIGTVDLWCDLASNVVIDAADLHSMGRAA